MDPEALKKALNELYQHLESLETQNTALLQFLTAKGIITDQEFAPFLEEAGKASYVKWLATRLRIEHTLASSAKETEKPAEIKTKPPAQEPEKENIKEPTERTSEETGPKEEIATAEDDAGQSGEKDEKKDDSGKPREKEAA